MSSDVPFLDARALLTAAVPGVPVEWPNEPFDEPVGDPPAMWISCDCIGRTLDPLEMVGGVWQETGTFYAYVMAPANTGTDAARVMAKTIANAFRGLGPRMVVYRSASIGAGASPADTKGLWWALPVTIEYIYQDASA